MPIMDGITATAELRKRQVTTPILGLSANIDEETRKVQIPLVGLGVGVRLGIGRS